MSIKFIVEKVILNKENRFTEEEIINDKRLKEYPYKIAIVHSILSGFISDGIINVYDYTTYKINKKRI